MSGTNNSSRTYVSLGLYNNAIFNSFRSINTGRTPVAAEIPQGDGQNAETSSRRDYNEVRDPAIDFLAALTILNTILGYGALALLIIDDQPEFALLVAFGLVMAFLLRAAAVYQYFEEAAFYKRLLNIFFGSRYGWRERYELKILKQANVGSQFGFPLVMHSVADLIQNAFTFYPLFILSVDTPELQSKFAAYFIVTLVVNSASMLGSLLVRLCYGASLIYLSLLCVYASLMVAFTLSLTFYREDFQDKLYTNGLVFPWTKFFLIVVSGFTTTAYEVRQKQRIILPGVISSLIGLLTLVDILAVILIQFQPDLFIEAEQNITDPNIIVDQIIYANAIYDGYVALFMFVQWRLLLHGGLG